VLHHGEKKEELIEKFWILERRKFKIQDSRFFCIQLLLVRGRKN